MLIFSLLTFLKWGLKQCIRSSMKSPESKTPGSPLRHQKEILSDPDKKAKIKNYLEIGLEPKEISSEKPYLFLPGQLIFGHTHIPFVKGTIEIEYQGRTRQIDVYNTGGWIVDTKEPAEIIQSHPLPLLVKPDGGIEPLDFPWPKKKGDIAKDSTVAGVVSYIKNKAK
jgi:hypothetical protein